MTSANSAPKSEIESIAFPVFDLSYAFDDVENPTQVTVYSDVEDEITTCWISMDVEFAVDLAEVA